MRRALLAALLTLTACKTDESASKPANAPGAESTSGNPAATEQGMPAPPTRPGETTPTPGGAAAGRGTAALRVDAGSPFVPTLELPAAPALPASPVGLPPL